jgi:hypothetical protein
MSKLDKWLNDHLNEKAVTVITTISSIFGVLLAMAIFLWLPIEIVDLFDNYLLVNHDISKYHSLIEGVLRIIIFILYMIAVSRMDMIKRVFMYHGAEHKTIFCYENGLELNVENVRKMSRFHPRCGTAFMFVMLILSMVLSFSLVLIFPGLATIIGGVIGGGVHLLRKAIFGDGGRGKAKEKARKQIDDAKTTNRHHLYVNVIKPFKQKLDKKKNGTIKIIDTEKDNIAAIEKFLVIVQNNIKHFANELKNKEYGKL